MAVYVEYLNALNKLDETEFCTFTDKFKTFKLETRQQYAIFFAARSRFYEKKACQLLGLKTEAERRKDASEKRYEQKARRILKIRTEDEKDIDAYQQAILALIDSGDHAQQSIFRLKKSLLALWVAFSIVVLFLLWQFLINS